MVRLIFDELALGFEEVRRLKDGIVVGELAFFQFAFLKGFKVADHPFI